MQQKSLQISERDAEISQEKADIENLRFEIEREKSKLKNEAHVVEQKKQDLMIKTKAFENMRFNITKDMNSFEEEKSLLYQGHSGTGKSYATGTMSKTAQFIQESTYIDKALLKREVSPVKVKSRVLEESHGRFNLSS
mmetsp:Transcript_10316/g.22728  ORF Transcript_10316/g.22728 Transcript_10316/m.22728 type:complete len:138 (-) Transcript_10316:439-852(-)